MKLATIRNNTRDGQLVVVSRDLEKAISVEHIAKTMQEALDNWQFVVNDLKTAYEELNQGGLTHSFKFNPQQAMAPLPRAYQWLDASAYVTHVELVRKSRGVEMPENFWTDPLMYQGASDDMRGAYDLLLVEDEDYGVDFEAEVAVITDDVPMSVSAAQAKDHIKLVTILNDVSFRNLAPGELKKGFGFIHAKPATTFAPVAVTPDELGSSWDGGRLHLPMNSYINDVKFGSPMAGDDMTFSFPQLIAHAAKTRRLTAGTILGSGTVSNKDKRAGSSCIVERRTIETLESGSPSTPYLKYGDRVRIEMLDSQGKSIFGDIQQEVQSCDSASAKIA